MSAHVVACSVALRALRHRALVTFLAHGCFFIKGSLRVMDDVAVVNYYSAES